MPCIFIYVLSLLPPLRSYAAVREMTQRAAAGGAAACAAAPLAALAGTELAGFRGTIPCGFLHPGQVCWACMGAQLAAAGDSLQRGAGCSGLLGAMRCNLKCGVCCSVVLAARVAGAAWWCRRRPGGQEEGPPGTCPGLPAAGSLLLCPQACMHHTASFFPEAYLRALPVYFPGKS